MNSHQLIVLADGLGDLGFGDTDSLDLQSRGHSSEVLLQSRLKFSSIWSERGWECEKGGCSEGDEEFVKFTTSHVIVYLVSQEYNDFLPVCDTESDPCWGWLGLACEIKCILTKQLNVNFL